jgi:glucan 1,3-beta-glucosidase
VAIATAYHVSLADMALWNPSLTATVMSPFYFPGFLLRLWRFNITSTIVFPTPSSVEKKYHTNNKKCDNWQDGLSYCVEANGAPTSTQSTITPTSSTTSSTPTSTVQPTWSALGCYLDSSNPPTLTNRTSIVGGDTAMTIEACETACFKNGFLYAGVEAGSQCWCGSYVGNELSSNSTDCGTPCAGKATQICGGTGRVNVYQGVLPIVSTSTTSTSTTTSSSTTSKTSSSATATGTLPAATWLPLGCYSDNSTALTLAHRTQVTGGDTKMSIELCEAACIIGGYSYAGVEAGSQCFCDSAVHSPGAPASDGSVGW